MTSTIVEIRIEFFRNKPLEKEEIQIMAFESEIPPTIRISENQASRSPLVGSEADGRCDPLKEQEAAGKGASSGARVDIIKSTMDEHG